jgi:hypothetical protein
MLYVNNPQEGLGLDYGSVSLLLVESPAVYLNPIGS